MARKYVDSYMKMSKQSLVDAVKAKTNELGWYHRLEHLRATVRSPFHVETINLKDFDKTNELGSIKAQVWAPYATDGGVVVVQWCDGKHVNVQVMGFENWLSDATKDAYTPINQALRTLAEHCRLYVNQNRQQAA